MKDISKLDLSHLIENAITPQFLAKLGQHVKEQIRRRARLGFGVVSDKAPQKKFDALKDSTVNTRENLQKRGLLSSDTKPKKSNLTRSGELLDSIEFKVVGIKVEVFIDGSRNQRVMEHLAKLGSGFSFFNLSKTETRELLDMLEDELSNHLRKQK